jgi:hypothetical protein
MNAFLLLLVSGIAGCSWSKDNPKPLISLQQGALDLSCLQKASPDLHELFQGNLTDSDADRARADSIWRCLDRALDVFSNFTTGSEEGAYRADELQQFANHFLKEDQKIDDSFRDSIFLLKTAVLGGTKERITKAEIAGLRKNLLRFGEAIHPLAPLLGTLLHPEKNGLKKREAALAALTRFTSSLASIFGESVHPLQWSELARFASDLERFIRADDPTALTLLHEQKDLLRNFKLLIVGGSDTLIEPSKWRPILEGFSSTLGAFLMSQNSVEMIDRITFRFLSTPREQTKAIQSLGREMKRLKANPALKTRALVVRLADYYIKGRLLLELALPEGKTPLSLNLLFDDSRLRSSEGRFIRRLFPSGQDTPSDVEPAQWMGFVRELIHQLDQTLLERTGRPSSFSLTRLQKICSENLELFSDPILGNRILTGIPLFLAFHSILNHKTGDEVFLSDLDPILEKTTQFLERPFQRDLPIQENFDRILAVMRRKPEITSIERSSLDGVLPHIAPMVAEVLREPIGKEDLSRVLEVIFRSKHLLWGTPEDRFNLDDFQEVGFLLSQSNGLRQSPRNAVDSLQKRWTKSGLDPAVSFEDLELVAKSPLTRFEPLQAIPTLVEHSKSIRIFRRFLLGTDSPLLHLYELSTMLSDGERIEKAVRDLDLKEMAAIIDALLGRPGALRIQLDETRQVLSSIEFLKPGSTGKILAALPAAMKIKHELLGTPQDGLVPADFEYLRQLLLIRDHGAQALLGLLARLERNGVMTGSRLDLRSLRELIVLLRNPDTRGSTAATPEAPDGLALIDELIEIKKNLFADPEPVIHSGDLKRWLELWLSAQKQPALAKARTLLSLILEIGSRQDLERDNLVELITRASRWMKLLGATPLDVKDVQSKVDLILGLKSVLLGTPGHILTRKELELIETALKITESKSSPTQKAAAYQKLLAPVLKRPIPLADLARVLSPIVTEFNLGSRLPVRLNLVNLRRLKILSVGGSSSEITPAELITLLQKSVTASSAGDWITTPAFQLNSASFAWLESAIQLAIETGKGVGLKEAYRNIEEAFRSSNRSLKLPMDKSLYGIWYHVLEGRKGLLPHQLGQSFELSDDTRIETRHLKTLAVLIRSIHQRLRDLEQAYAASANIQVTNQLLRQRLKNPGNLYLIDTFVPTLRRLNGVRTLSLEKSVETSNEFILEELSYKTVLSEALAFLFRQYNTRNGDSRLNTQEFSLLLDDIRAPMINFGVIYKSGPPAEVAARQMRTINLMTRTGNGDSWLDVDETVDFMSMGYGSANSFDRLINVLSTMCRQLDVSGLPGFEGRCVIRNLFDSEYFGWIFGDMIPGTVGMYQALKGTFKTRFEVTTLKLTGKNLLQEKPRSWWEYYDERTLDDYSYVNFDYDMLQSIHAVHPMLEGVFQMMDSNNNEQIELAEALAYFPRFCPAIQAAAAGRISGNCTTAEGAKDFKKLYGYLLVNRKKPGMGFYFWDSKWAKIQKGQIAFIPLRRYDMITIFSNLSP